MACPCVSPSGERASRTRRRPTTYYLPTHLLPYYVLPYYVRLDGVDGVAPHYLLLLPSTHCSHSYSLTTYHLPLTTYHLPLTTYHLPLTTYRLPLTAYHLPPPLPLPRQATPSQMEQLGLLPNKKTVLVVGGGDGVGTRSLIEPRPATACNTGCNTGCNAGCITGCTGRSGKGGDTYSRTSLTNSSRTDQRYVWYIVYAYVPTNEQEASRRSSSRPRRSWPRTAPATHRWVALGGSDNVGGSVTSIVQCSAVRAGGMPYLVPSSDHGRAAWRVTGWTAWY